LCIQKKASHFLRRNSAKESRTLKQIRLFSSVGSSHPSWGQPTKRNSCSLWIRHEDSYSRRTNENPRGDQCSLICLTCSSLSLSIIATQTRLTHCGWL